MERPDRIRNYFQLEPASNPIPLSIMRIPLSETGEPRGGLPGQKEQVRAKKQTKLLVQSFLFGNCHPSAGTSLSRTPLWDGVGSASGSIGLRNMRASPTTVPDKVFELHPVFNPL